MPELPEMETYKHLLNTVILHKKITGVKIEREKSINIPPPLFTEGLLGREFVNVDRRAKQLIFTLNNNTYLLLHLMLGGWMYYGNESTKPNRTAQVEIAFGHYSLYFIGLRLGYVHLLSKEQLIKEIDEYGPDPFQIDFTASLFKKRLQRKRGKLKTTLIDQRFIAGIGNCYSDEICFDAGLLPTRELLSLEDNEIQTLYHSMKSVLADAIKYGGYMENPLYEGDRLTGQYDERCRVYDRGGEPCVRCGTAIVKEELSSRKVFFCPNCQH